MNSLLSQFIDRHLETINQQLLAHLPKPLTGGERLHEAMLYSLLNGGKRIRPLLALSSAEACGGINASTWVAAAAIEYIHAYSLIHDDLPAMDDDDLRRGKPTCHIAFDEATAILAGDALQCAAFECLSASSATLPLIATLAKASGARGMVAGQAIDLAAVDTTLAVAELSHMHRHKTGALIEASVVMGAMSAGASQERLDALKRYASAIGLAFQVQDDILDVTADTTELGKQQGADAANNKPTYVSILGLDAAREKATTLLTEGLSALEGLNNADVLVAIAEYIIARSK